MLLFISLDTNGDKMKYIVCFIILSSFCIAQRRDTLVWIPKTVIIYNAKKAVEDNKTRIKILQEENIRYEGQLLFFDALDDSVKVWIMKPDTTQAKRKPE